MTLAFLKEADDTARQGVGGWGLGGQHPVSVLQTNCSEATWKEGCIPGEGVRMMAGIGFYAIRKEVHGQSECRKK